MKFVCMLLLFVATACGQPVDDTSAKPERNPDTHMIDGRADQLTDYYTSIVGTLPLDGLNVEGEIGYPDWFHGYTLELEAGQEILFDLYATDLGYLQLYGPETGTDASGNPRFGDALGGGMIQYSTEFTFNVRQTGTYMLVYGPRYVWNTTYDFAVECTNCRAEAECNGDFECEESQFCGENGVRCVTAPCTANFDICKPRLGEGSFCSRDQECAEGSKCEDNACVVTPVCTQDRDCFQGFCGYDANRDRVCKPYADEGTFCGGFVRPEDYRQCTPDLSCNAPTFVADVGGTCGFNVTVSDLLVDPAEYDGRHVGITGFINSNIPYCTRRACPADDLCCNQCGTGLELLDNETGVDSIQLKDAATGENYGCTGDECNMQQECTVEPDSIYFVAGTFTWDPQFQVGTLDVTRKFKGFTVLP